LNTFNDQRLEAEMDWKLAMYTAYIALSVALTWTVARSLYRNGKVFLISVFDGDQELAGSVNQLLVVGFYLINLGFVSFMLRTGDVVSTATGAVELLSRKMGLVLLVLGVMHLGNLTVLNRMRRRKLASQWPSQPVPRQPIPSQPQGQPYDYDYPAPGPAMPAS
jgi:hypothetical protein